MFVPHCSKNTSSVNHWEQTYKGTYTRYYYLERNLKQRTILCFFSSKVACVIQVLNVCPISELKFIHVDLCPKHALKSLHWIFQDTIRLKVTGCWLECICIIIRTPNISVKIGPIMFKINSHPGQKTLVSSPRAF